MVFKITDGDIKELINTFKYDPESGFIFSKNKRVGFIDSRGYVSVSYKGRPLKAHRLAWILYYGENPKVELDHINRITIDNRIKNLRLADRYINNNNRGKQIKKYGKSKTYKDKFNLVDERNKLWVFDRLLDPNDDIKTIPFVERYFPCSFKNSL